MLRLEIPPSTGVLLRPLLPLRAVPIAALRRCIPTNTCCIAKESFVAYSLPRMHLKVSSGKISVKQRAWNCVAKKMHTPNSPYAICFSYRMNLLALRQRILKIHGMHDEPIRTHSSRPSQRANSSERLGSTINRNNCRAGFRKLIESVTRKICTQLSRSHDPNC
jgi:hypothetical protein